MSAKGLMDMIDITTNIAKQITKYRKMVGLSKKELSEAVDVAPSTVSGWENADYAPGANTLVRLCDLFDITLDEIYGLGTETKKAPAKIDEGKYAETIKLLEKLPDAQIGEVNGFIKHLIYDNEAAEAVKQISDGA